MVQETSLDVYYHKVLPTLGRRQRQVWNLFETYNRQNLTNMEAAELLGWSINRVTPRVLELRELGLLVFSRRRRCTVTGNFAMAWKLKEA